jgi:hypothetical protein
MPARSCSCQPRRRAALVRAHVLTLPGLDRLGRALVLICTAFLLLAAPAFAQQQPRLQTQITDLTRSQVGHRSRPP